MNRSMWRCGGGAGCDELSAMQTRCEARELLFGREDLDGRVSGRFERAVVSVERHDARIGQDLARERIELFELDPLGYQGAGARRPG